jgi:putative effector of murein hydrolase LrgA (UPF0299 family)
MMSLIYTMQILFENIYVSINKNTNVSLIELLSINLFNFISCIIFMCVIGITTKSEENLIF